MKKFSPNLFYFVKSPLLCLVKCRCCSIFRFPSLEENSALGKRGVWGERGREAPRVQPKTIQQFGASILCVTRTSLARVRTVLFRNGQEAFASPRWFQNTSQTAKLSRYQPVDNSSRHGWYHCATIKEQRPAVRQLDQLAPPDPLHYSKSMKYQQVIRHGHSLAVVIPVSMTRELGLHRGDAVRLVLLQRQILGEDTSVFYLEIQPVVNDEIFAKTQKHG